MATEDRELPIPTMLHTDDAAVEVIRVWRTGEGRIAAMMNFGGMPDPRDWGIVVADVVNYVADCAMKRGLTRTNGEGESVPVSRTEFVQVIVATALKLIDQPIGKITDWEPKAKA